VGDGTQGLRAEYFDDKNLSQPVLARIDPVIDFNWGNGSPDPSIDANTFSVRWSGEITALSSETHTFTVRTDDGVRLWVDGQLVVDQWIDQSPTEHSGLIDLVGGVPVPIQMEYYENGGGAEARLYWETPSLAREIVPSSQLNPLTGVVTDAPPAIVHADELRDNYPNPFNPRTSIAFSLSRRSEVSLEVYDLRGRRVRTLLGGEILEPGTHAQEWNGRDRDGNGVASGVYFYRLRARPVDGGTFFEDSRRMILLK
jgi:hypothetical protein